MNAIFFALKRGFHGTLRIARSTLASLGLTAARFDLLYALMESDGGIEGGFGTYQSEIRQTLGVSRPTVSRMLQSLEDLGLVRRERSDLDRRQLEVYLTRRGRSLIRFAHRLLTRGGWAHLAVDSALGATSLGDNRWCDSQYALSLRDGYPRKPTSQGSARLRRRRHSLLSLAPRRLTRDQRNCRANASSSKPTRTTVPESTTERLLRALVAAFGENRRRAPYATWAQG